MADKVAITIKVIAVWLYYTIFTPLAEIIVQQNQNRPHEAVFYFFILMLFLPELTAIISKSFRVWIKSGIEDADGSLNKEDLTVFITHLAALYSLRIFVMMGLVMIFYDIQIDFQFYIIPFLGSMGLEGLAVINKMYTRNQPPK